MHAISFGPLHKLHYRKFHYLIEHRAFTWCCMKTIHYQRLPCLSNVLCANCANAMVNANTISTCIRITANDNFHYACTPSMSAHSSNFAPRFMLRCVSEIELIHNYMLVGVGSTASIRWLRMQWQSCNINVYSKISIHLDKK